MIGKQDVPKGFEAIGDAVSLGQKCPHSVKDRIFSDLVSEIKAKPDLRHVRARANG